MAINYSNYGGVESRPEDMDYSSYGLEEEKPKDEQSFISKLPRNVLAGLALMGHGILNAPHNLANLVSPELAKKIPSQPEHDYAQMLGLPKEPTTADKVVRGLSQYGIAAGLPVADMGIAGEAASIGTRMAANAVPQAAFGATQNPNPIEGAEEGAIAGAGGELIPFAIESGYNSLKPSSLLRGELPAKDLAKNLEDARGTETPLGRIIGSPALNRLYENILPNVVGSNAENTMQRTNNHITNKAQSLLNFLDNPENVGSRGQILKDALTKSAQDAKLEKNAGFENLNNFADLINHRVERKNIRSTADSILSEINSSPELARLLPDKIISDLKFYKNTGKEKEILSDFKDSLESSGFENTGLEADEKDLSHTLKNSNILRGKIGDTANDYYTNGQMYEYGVAKRLKDALGKDIEDSFVDSKNPELKSMYAQNQKDYREKFAPFEDPDIVRFTRQGGDPDTLLPHFLKGGRNDRAVILTKLTSKLNSDDPAMRNIVAFAHLSKAVDADGQVNSVKMSSLYRSLGPNQKKALVPDAQTRAQLESFSNLVGMNKESFDLMRNPKTGVRVNDLAIKVAQYIGLGGSLAGGMPGVAGSLVAGGIASRGANKLLTNPSIRENLVKKMLNPKDSKIPARDMFKTLMQLELNDYSGTK